MDTPSAEKKILAISQKLFSQFGLKRVTVDDIAREAQVSKTTIYKSYRNKEAIFISIVDLETDTMIARINESIAAASTVRDMFYAFLLTKINNIQHLTNFYKVTRDSWDYHWPFIKEARDRMMLEERAIIEKILKHGNKTGETSIENTALLAHVLMISLKPVEFSWALEDFTIATEEIVGLMVDTFTKGVYNLNGNTSL